MYKTLEYRIFEVLKKYISYFCCVGFVSIILIGCTIHGGMHSEKAVPHIIQDIVSGVSMYPLIDDGQTVDILTNYREFGELQRGDVVIYNYGGELRKGNPLIKRIIAIPGDNFTYTGGYIFLNGLKAKNSEGYEYILTSNMLELYAREYPKLPEKTYLIMGDRIGGTTDSSVFGLVSEDDIIGKVIKW